MTLLAETTTSRSLVLDQDIRYEFAAPVERLRQRLIVVPPPVHGAQRRIDWSLTVTGVDGIVRRTRTDRFGNVVIDVGAPRVERWIRFAVEVEVERVASHEPHTIAVDPRFLRPTPLTRADARIRNLVGPGAGPADICARVRRSLTYEWGITDVGTSAAAAIHGGRGVCQDFAHVMIAACRDAGIAARYVSGHLVGEGGSHAWVETLLPLPARPGEWVVEAWDPTHDQPAGDGYVTIAVGRDYADVAPLSGTFVATTPTSHLSVRKRLGQAA
ncbi:MAG TPA: transglutaminase family protein [Acidimicrobiales bacterium]|nr:transglutaminase family protein [Acidimicrobiales bacterium]